MITLDLTVDDLARIYQAVGAYPAHNENELERDVLIMDILLHAIEDLELSEEANPHGVDYLGPLDEMTPSLLNIKQGNPA